MHVFRCFVEKKDGFNGASQSLKKDLTENLGISGIENVRILIRYDIEGISEQEYEAAKTTIFSEPPVELIHDEQIELADNEIALGIEYLPGQYDQRADSAAQCIQLLSHRDPPRVATAKVIVIKGTQSNTDIRHIKHYLINPVDSREASMKKPSTLVMETEEPPDVAVVEGFCQMERGVLEALRMKLALAMSNEDLLFCQNHFRVTERRDPTITEIRMLDTYWSDHCRHTTFLSSISSVEFDDRDGVAPVCNAYTRYREVREKLYSDRQVDICLMDIATIAMKALRKEGLLDDLDASEEINACSIQVPVDIEGKAEEWLVMFKNETHNHPTEIEPFGGAATCLGGAIRDPLSGRAYVYQAMRVTGSGDPRTPVEQTIPGKLPQRTITVGAANGYSSYGNQIGLATGVVSEIYHPGYVAKRMEVGAVIAAAPKENVLRMRPAPGDRVLLVGGRTGRDGCGGATGSSKEHTEESITTCGAEVQKGNPPTERKLQRLFRNREASRLIKRCNDFGAGGVSVAIGELADGVDIFLDTVPRKYEGLDGTELAISESQERMAVVVAAEDVERFIEHALSENVEATEVARVTDTGRVRMFWRNRTIVDISRAFIDTNGVRQQAHVYVGAPENVGAFFENKNPTDLHNESDIQRRWLANCAQLNVCSQKGLGERFDSTIGAGTVLLPYGGRYQLTPNDAMVAKIPVEKAETGTATAMSWGFDPYLSERSPFHGAVYAVVESVAKIVAVGGDYRRVRLTCQEYFEKLGADPVRWGKPFSALLGSFYAQMELQTPSIGGKDSMSGTFNDMDVPPTLVSFGVCALEAGEVCSPEFKRHGSLIFYIQGTRDRYAMPDFEHCKKVFETVHTMILDKKIITAKTVRTGGVAAAASTMALGNRIGLQLDDEVDFDALFIPDYGGFVVEVACEQDGDELVRQLGALRLGTTIEEERLCIGQTTIPLKAVHDSWSAPLEKIFPNGTSAGSGTPGILSYTTRSRKRPTRRVAAPRVFIPVFPGTNCEYDSVRIFETHGAVCNNVVFKNLTPSDIDNSITEMVEQISTSQIVMIPGGFSAGDEPEGSGKFIAAVFRNSHIKEAVHTMLYEQDGLMLGICNGFQALVKLGLVPYGEIRDLANDSPTLTYNTIGRHVSRMVYTRVASVLSPWFSECEAGEVHCVAVSHGEGRFVAPRGVIDSLKESGQIATQYVDINGTPSDDFMWNPNGSIEAIEGVTSPDGRVLGKMAHAERTGNYVASNIEGVKDQKIFRSGVSYFL
jgi:phosphoribosylformylglycinamidine synthase